MFEYGATRSKLLYLKEVSSYPLHPWITVTGQPRPPPMNDIGSANKRFMVAGGGPSR
jgi:hypothetical protein